LLEVFAATWHAHHITLSLWLLAINYDTESASALLEMRTVADFLHFLFRLPFPSLIFADSVFIRDPIVHVSF